MDTQYAIFIAVAAGAFAIALLAVMTQWLKADDAALDAEVGVRESMRRLAEQTAVKDTQPAKGPTAAIAPELSEAHPAYKLADDETALSRLLLGWTAAGTFTGLAIGGTLFGLVGALIGGVVLAAVAVVGVVVGVLVVDRVHAGAVERRRLETLERARADAALPPTGISAEANA